MTGEEMIGVHGQAHQGQWRMQAKMLPKYDVIMSSLMIVDQLALVVGAQSLPDELWVDRTTLQIDKEACVGGIVPQNEGRRGEAIETRTIHKCNAVYGAEDLRFGEGDQPYGRKSDEQVEAEREVEGGTALGQGSCQLDWNEGHFGAIGDEDRRVNVVGVCSTTDRRISLHKERFVR